MKEKLRKRFIKKDEWPPSSPDLNVLEFYFWIELSKNIHDGRFEPFQSIEPLKRRIRRVWNRSIKLDETRNAIKRFIPRLNVVVEEEGGPIKHIFS